MEPYPLADAPPPRYAVESDDEDEYNPLSAPSTSDLPPDVEVEFKSIYDIPSKKPLIFASGDAGISWAKIVNLGEQRAVFYVNKFPAGLLFSPSWTSAVIVLSETETRLPLFAMTAYTTAVIERLQPTSVAILDSYSTRGYISSRMISQENAPVRYLSVGKKPVPDSELKLFAPPNLLQSATASMLIGLFLRDHGINESLVMDATIVVLLPAPRVSPSSVTFDSKEATGDFSDSNWDRQMLEKTHKWLFAIVGQGVDESSLWTHTELAVRTPGFTGTMCSIGEVGRLGVTRRHEEGIYI